VIDGRLVQTVLNSPIAIFKLLLVSMLGSIGVTQFMHCWIAVSASAVQTQAIIAAGSVKGSQVLNKFAAPVHALVHESGTGKVPISRP